MAHIRLEGQKIHAVLIASGGIGMPEGMGRDVVHAKGTQEGEKFPLEPLFIHGLVQAALLGEKPFRGALPLGKGVPVLQDHLPDTFRKGDITVRMVLGLTDMNLHGRMVNIGTSEMAQFVKPHPGGIEDGDGEFEFRTVRGLQDACHLLRGRDVGKEGVKSAEREPGFIPVLMQDIRVEELEIRDDHVDGTVGKIPFGLNPVKKVAHILPGSIFGQDGTGIKIVQIRFDIGGVRADRVIRKPFGMKHLNKR